MHSKIFHKSINIRNILDGNITIPTSLAVRTTWNVFAFPIYLLDHILLFHFQRMKVRIVRCRCILLIYLLTYSIKYLYFKYTKQHMVLFLKEMHYKKNNVSRITFMHSFLSVHQDRSTKKEGKKRKQSEPLWRSKNSFPWGFAFIITVCWFVRRLNQKDFYFDKASK